MDLTVTNLTLDDITRAVRNELEIFFQDHTFPNQTEQDDIGGIELAIELTGLAKPTIYSLVSTRKIPHSKPSKRLYFSRRELLEWLAAGKRKTQTEIAVEAANLGQKEKVR